MSRRRKFGWRLTRLVVGDGGAVAGDGGAVPRDGGAVAGDGGPVARNGGAVAGDRGMVADHRSAAASRCGGAAEQRGVLAGDRGAASILVLAIGLLMVAAGSAGAAIGNTRVARHRAHNAADLGALAGAMHAIYGQGDACIQAARIVAANGGRMTECTVTGLEIVVRVQVEVRPLPGLVREAEAAARAGPVYALSD